MSLSVPEAFDGVAHGYDRLVGASPGYHAHLRLSARRMDLPDRGAGRRLLDLGCGTGASTAALLAAAPDAEIVAVDGSAGMLEHARAKRWPPSVRFVHARAESLVAALEGAGVAGPFDGVLAAYLVRNLPDADAGLKTVRALLKPGGVLAVHDYSVADSVRARWIWTAVSWGIIIPSGAVVTRDASIYRYLWRSVLAFDGVTAFESRLARVGFGAVHTLPMPGWQRGITHTFLARRPLLRGAPPDSES